MYGGLHAGVTVKISPYLSMHLALFAQRDLPRTFVRQHTFRIFSRYRDADVQWRLDSSVYGAMLELRIGVR